MRPIRSSEIGSYLYCRRSWWYRKIGTPSENQSELAAGTELHKKHGRQVLASILTRTVGLILFVAAILLLVAYCTAQVI
jgi:CRISPR/Cas system-associated exonuclease Cas4 (RecB family)